MAKSTRPKGDSKQAGDASLPLVGSPRERLRHVAWSLIVATVMAVMLLLEPLDWTIWNFQSRMGNQTPSGEIVYVQADRSLTDPGVPSQRFKLAAALDRLRAEDVDRVYIDAIFSDDATDPRADQALRSALKKWGAKAFFVNRIDITPGGHSKEIRSVDWLTSETSVVWNGVMEGWPGFIYQIPYAYSLQDGSGLSMAASLAGKSAASSSEFQIDYRFRSRSIPALTLDQATKDRVAANGLSLAGKSVVIGLPRDPANPEMYLPGQFKSPASFVPIFGAETLKGTPPTYVPGLPVLVLVAGLLTLGSVATKRRTRYFGYVLGVGVPAYSILAAPTLGLRVELSYCFPLLVTFALFRWRANWKRRVAHIEPDTGLPTLRAFTLALSNARATAGYVIVAKIHGYETILQTLDGARRADYVRKLVERLKVADPYLTVFIDGHYLAWQVDHDDDQKLRGHLEGLRAIFAAPVKVGGDSIDVGITFGAAHIEAGEGERTLAAALGAVEGTSEALEPVRLADARQDGDSLWDLSLRSRIDAAMEAGEVFCVYQPKMDIAADRIIGVEALVRWEDPERGFIPPLHFVMQCEKAGRMEYLTRYVMQSACSAGRLLHFRGSRITMSVNISATLLSDMRIVGIVRNVLQATDFDPNYLVLEITETARIRDLTQARAVLKALKALGARLSMDDFGVGSANFEALRALPFDELKIDRQFVTGATESFKTRAIAASLVGLGTSARIAVVAEGAETEADLQMLRDIGCWQVQGYALARPMPLTNLLNFIEPNNDQRTAL